MAVNENTVVNITGYKFEPLDDPIGLVSIYQRKCDELLLKGSMLISKNGINFSLAGTQEATCLLYTSPSPRDRQKSRMPSSA